MSLEAKNICYLAGNRYLFRSINFNLLPGQLLAIRGQNGAGKTTLLKILAGLTLPKKGEIRWGKEKINKSMDYTHRLSYVGHKDALNPDLTAIENIKMQLTLSQSTFDQEALQVVFKHFSLIALQNQFCGQLSAGEKRKIALSALLLKNKPLWILDEPYTALDKPSTEILNRYLHDHLSNKGMIIMASHLPFDHIAQVINL